MGFSSIPRSGAAAVNLAISSSLLTFCETRRRRREEVIQQKSLFAQEEFRALAKGRSQVVNTHVVEVMVLLSTYPAESETQ